jgi:hypothetical protein
MSQKLESAIAVIGIDIGKNSFHVVGHDERGAIGRSGRVARLKHALPTCHRAWSAWKPASARIISAANSIALDTMPG